MKLCVALCYNTTLLSTVHVGYLAEGGGENLQMAHDSSDQTPHPD